MPRLLFDKTNATLVKLRRDIKTQKLKGWPNYKLDVIKSTLPILVESGAKEDLTWLPNDDFVVLHVGPFLFLFFLFFFFFFGNLKLLSIIPVYSYWALIS